MSRYSLGVFVFATLVAALLAPATSQAGSFTNCGERTVGPNSTLILKGKGMTCGNARDLAQEADQRIRQGDLDLIGDTTSIRRFDCKRINYFDPYEPAYECKHESQDKKLKALYPPEREPVKTAPAKRGNPIKGTNGCGDIQVEPELVVFTCADFGLRAESLNWDNWGQRTAVAQGTLAAKDCIPSCADGGVDYYPVTLIFRHIKTVRTCGGREIRMYTKYKMDTDNGQPAGFGHYDKGPLALFC